MTPLLNGAVVGVMLMVAAAASWSDDEMAPLAVFVIGFAACAVARFA